MDGKNGTSRKMRNRKTTKAAANKLNDNPEARKSRKRKSENNEKLAVEKEETTLETDNQLIPTPLSHIPLKSLTDVETELVYMDEEDIPFEFAGPVASTSKHSAPRRSKRAAALRAADGSALPRVDKELQRTLWEASTSYRQKNYEVAAEQFSAALELCSKGAAIDSAFEPSPEDISSVTSFIETKLVTCYLKLKKPDDALNHSHRSIILNPAYFRNHLRQAAAFRCLERYSEAARSAMIADYLYWLTGGTEQHTSKLIKLYWQAMIEEAITREKSFSVMYTPFVTEVKADKKNKIKEVFAEKHPDYAGHVYTDPHGLHILPQTAEWPSLPPQQYLLTLGFRNKHIGKTLERWSGRKLPVFSDRKAPFTPLTAEETRRYWDNTGKKMVPVMDFIRSTRLTDRLCACSRGIEKLHYASLLGRLQRGEERSQVINQAMAELATVPYLQDVSKKDAKLLQSLMADAMDTLEGRSSDKGRAWNKIEKIGLIEDYLYQVEDNYLRNKRLRTARMEKMKMKKIQSAQQH
ncbi:spermatogenesis-associated protein 16 [Alca torda]